jgi:hypothetical protein
MPSVKKPGIFLCMPEPNLFQIFVSRMNQLSLTYMITGAVAGIIYGEPRLTTDIDMVVDLKADEIDPFSDAFPIEDFYRNMPACPLACQGDELHPLNSPPSGGVRGGGSMANCSPPPWSSPVHACGGSSTRGRKTKDAPSAGGGPRGASLIEVLNVTSSLPRGLR